jgi:phosphoribosylaminoimidazole-succinocarboxamide synthase
MKMGALLTRTDFPELSLRSRGKVRDIYEIEDWLLLVATDRISAFDVVFAEAIPNKGRVLTQLAAFWFHKTRHIIENHLITADFEEFPLALRALKDLRGRATLCRKARVMPIECVARGYLEGSAWKEYQETGGVAGIQLPRGLKRRSRLGGTIFTPATKAEVGHDENISFLEMVDRVGPEAAQAASEATTKLYNFAHDWLEKRGIILADTKFEFGWVEDRLILIDEALTPDSSRFWVKGTIEGDSEPVSFDKQYLRDYLETTGWNKQPPPPPLPDSVIEQTARRYVDIYQRITGQPLED